MVIHYHIDSRQLAHYVCIIYGILVLSYYSSVMYVVILLKCTFYVTWVSLTVDALSKHDR